MIRIPPVIGRYGTLVLCKYLLSSCWSTTVPSTPVLAYIKIPSDDVDGSNSSRAQEDTHDTTSHQ